MAGSKPGERRGGRKAGTPNKATADVRALAQQYTAPAIRSLAAVAGLLPEAEGKAESEAARVGALKELLDRGHGRAVQGVTLGPDAENGPAIIKVIERVIVEKAQH